MLFLFFFKQKTAYEMRISDWSSDVCSSDLIISSTRIRQALKSGDCETATRLLTRPFTIEGVVQHGDKLGRTIGFPTANIDMGHYLRPAYGIYAVRALLPDGRVLDGAANLGIRPSIDPPKELLEPHFFDFSESLYDQRRSAERRVGKEWVSTCRSRGSP